MASPASSTQHALSHYLVNARTASRLSPDREGSGFPSPPPFPSSPRRRVCCFSVPPFLPVRGDLALSMGLLWVNHRQSSGQGLTRGGLLVLWFCYLRHLWALFNPERGGGPRAAGKDVVQVALSKDSCRAALAHSPGAVHTGSQIAVGPQLTRGAWHQGLVSASRPHPGSGPNVLVPGHCSDRQAKRRPHLSHWTNARFS